MSRHGSVVARLSATCVLAAGRRESPTRQAILTCLLLSGLSAAVPVSASATAPLVQWPSGAVDPSFASGGVLSPSFPDPPGVQEGRDAAIQSDEKIVVLTTSAYTSYLSRYLPDGEPDMTFGSGGSLALPDANQNAYTTITLDAQGRIIVAGAERSSAQAQLPRYQGVVYRFLPDGKPDTGFGVDGKTALTVPPPENLAPEPTTTFVGPVVVASDGSLMVGGVWSVICAIESIEGGGQRIIEEAGSFVARLSSSGTPQSQFGNAGIVSTHSQCYRPPEGFGGLVQTAPDTFLSLVDHLEDHTWHFRTYSSTGLISEVPVTINGYAPYQLMILPDHDLLVGAVESYYAEALLRFTPQGIPDPTFGTSGHVAIPSLTCTLGPGCFATLPDGSILAAGRVMYGNEIGVERFQPGGARDDSFGDNGNAAWAELPGGKEGGSVDRLLVFHGEPLVVGTEQVPARYAESQTALTLFRADGGFSSLPQPNPGEGPFYSGPSLEESAPTGSQPPAVTSSGTTHSALRPPPRRSQSSNPTLPRRCIVPRLKGLSLARARRALGQSHCRIGAVHRSRRGKRSRRHKAATVFRQSPRAGSHEPVGTAVSLWVAR